MFTILRERERERQRESKKKILTKKREKDKKKKNNKTKQTKSRNTSQDQNSDKFSKIRQTLRKLRKIRQIQKKKKHLQTNIQRNSGQSNNMDLSVCLHFCIVGLKLAELCDFVRCYLSWFVPILICNVFIFHWSLYSFFLSLSLALSLSLSLSGSLSLSVFLMYASHHFLSFLCSHSISLPLLHSLCPSASQRFVFFLWYVQWRRPISPAICHRGRSHRKPDRSGSPKRRHFASLDLKIMPIFASQASIAGFSQKVFLAFSCDFRSSYCVFASLAKNVFASLAIWGCAIRIASHVAVASRNLGH